MDDFLFAAWLNGLRAIRRNPVWFLLAFILLLPILRVITPHLVTVTAATSLHTILWRITLNVANALVCTPAGLATYRFLRLTPGADRGLFANPARLWRFLAANLGLTLLILVPIGIFEAAVALRHHAPGALVLSLMLVGLAAIIAAIILYIRLALALPAIAVDQPTPWHASWRATNGHWWMITVTAFIAQLPIAAVAAMLGFILRQSQGAHVIALVGIGAAATVLKCAALSALYARFHQQYLPAPTP